MIHPTALIHAGAVVADTVEIGPYTIVGEQVQIGAGTKIGAHCVVTGRTRIGRDNRIFHSVSLGEVPQDKKYGGEDTALEIGDGNTIREFCTFNIGTTQDKKVTRVGNQNWFMAYVHVAHDCQVGNHTTFANCTQLAGHVDVGDHAVLGGFTGVHQFCRVGAHAITGVGSVVLADVPPFVTAMGNTARPHGVNSEGLRRRGFSDQTLKTIRRAYKLLYRENLSFEQAKAAIETLATTDAELQVMVDFLATTKRSIIR